MKKEEAMSRVKSLTERSSIDFMSYIRSCEIITYLYENGGEIDMVHTLHSGTDKESDDYDYFTIDDVRLTWCRYAEKHYSMLAIDVNQKGEFYVYAYRHSLTSTLPHILSDHFFEGHSSTDLLDRGILFMTT